MLRLQACLSGILKPNSSLFKLHHLRYLDLNHNNFTPSPLTSEFGSLHRLEYLSLYSNGFVGQVPSSFNSLSHLSVLELTRNELTGSFPLLRNLTKLSALSLAGNQFSGTLNPNSSSLFEFHHLRYLSLGYNNFSSSLPSEFGNLNKLEYLSLKSNDFSGQVPPTISNLTSLKELYLQDNQLTGTFPLVHNLTMLSVLNLDDNNFSGPIPSFLVNMPFLSDLRLYGNNLTGSVEFPNSSRLEKLHLGQNHFEGKIIESILKLVNLKVLDLSFLKTSYPIDVSHFSSLKSLLSLDLSGTSISPVSLDSKLDISKNLAVLRLSGCGISEFPNILKILEINVSGNKIKGKVPEWLWKLPRLNTLYVSNNSFNGLEGPVDVLINSSVKNLFMEQNRFEGAIPALPLSINIFEAPYNRFTGSIPLSICNCRSLTDLWLSYNNLTGPIPQCLSNLTFVNLRKNSLEGSVPDAFYKNASLQTLDVGHNRLTGKLPRSLKNCSSLEFLVADHNRIKDKFPFWLKALPNLQVITFSSNKFYGSISSPGQEQLLMGDCTLLPETIDFRYKGLSMEQQMVLNSYAAIDFSGNRIEGQIPESIGLLKSLIALNLSNTAFTGHIPLSFSNLRNLESLDLLSNQLSGTIPSGLGTLAFLAYINVSHNQFKGEIPQGTQIIGQARSSFEGNAGLCGLPLQETCFGTNAPPTQPPPEEDEEEEQVLNWKGVAMGYGVGVFLGLAITQVIASYKPEWLVQTSAEAVSVFFSLSVISQCV
ncbi:hypothetical protein F2Q69_00017154 [Brassica cretica]|uniref:Disease resistance R13L4/SHOC-2-like LRR domain-containing protein n=1 Tax=Brassica cretica TaxID=69181 RepID=A0A8S9R715_BRACR|nr:hypothetical protein F2Q69_00017154 [Brassica cretica]